MKRRHNNKRIHHFYAKYWKTIGNRKNVFTDGRWILVSCSYVPIVRYPKLKQGMNPYKDSKYFEKRKDFISTKNKLARKRVAAANPAYA